MLISSAIVEPIQSDDDSIVLAICKTGTFASDENGKIFRFTENALKSSAPSWVGGKIRINHKHPEQGTITESWFESPFLMARISGLTEKTRSVIESPAYMGVSQDSLPVALGEITTIKSHAVTDIEQATGTGVSIMIYPETPACPLSEGCGVPIKSEAIGGIPGDEVVHEYDVGKINNAGRIVKTKEIRIWLSGEEANNTILLKERIASEAAWGQLGVFNIYPRNHGLQVGDEITGIEPEHVVSTIVSAYPDVFNSPLNTESPKIDTEPLGGPSMDENIIPNFEELMKENTELKAKVDELSKQVAENPAQVEAAVKAALASHEIKMKEEKEIEAIQGELKSCMPEGFEEFIATSPSKATMRATIKALRSANPIGAPAGVKSSIPEKFQSGSDIYSKLGVSVDDVAKYNGGI